MKRLILPPLALILLSSPAYAYLDPGVGSMLLQALAAAALAVSFFWKGLVQKVRRLISGYKESNAANRTTHDE